MAYNYGPPPGAYHARQPSYGQYGAPPSMGPPPGMDPPPGMMAPGMPAHSPGGQPQQQFQMPPNMPNFNAPVIRLGVPDQQKPSSPADRITSGQGSGRGDGFRSSNAEPIGRRDRAGLGAGTDSRNIERDRAAVRESMMALQPPTREEVARTIFIGGLGDNAPSDAAIEDVLRCAGKLRRWTRARDADDKLCKFGFAEYEDVDSLDAANEIYQELEVTMMKGGVAIKDAESGEVKKAKLLVVVDEQSKTYIKDWKGKDREDDEARQFRLDGCREDLRQCLAALANAGAFQANGQLENGDLAMADGANGENGDNAEVVTIPVALDDELADIPAEMRATVAAEIKAFRDRSIKRDLERLKREEEMEQAERQRSAPRINRIASPPPSSAPSGPASAANGIPVGPRAAAPVPNAPAGPRGYRGAQLPSDYVNGVNFVGPNGAANGYSLNRDDEDDPASDDELERRRKAKKDEQIAREFEHVETRWLRRETTRAAAQDRERAREVAEEKKRSRGKEEMAKLLREWDDDKEAKKQEDLYYADHTTWERRRQAIREAEMKADARDREDEERERMEERRRTAEARGMADDFMSQMDSEMSSRPSTTTDAAPVASAFKISLGSAAQRTRPAASANQGLGKRGMGAEAVESLLEDEDEAAASGVRKPLQSLKPLPAAGTYLTDEEKAEARQNLAAEIPTSTDELFAYPLAYTHLTTEVLEGQIRPFVQKKVVELLGVQEEDLVDVAIDGLKERTGAKGIVEVLGEAVGEEEAVGLIRKVWRMAVFLGEMAVRGLA